MLTLIRTNANTISVAFSNIAADLGFSAVASSLELKINDSAGEETVFATTSLAVDATYSAGNYTLSVDTGTGIETLMLEFTGTFGTAPGEDFNIIVPIEVSKSYANFPQLTVQTALSSNRAVLSFAVPVNTVQVPDVVDSLVFLLLSSPLLNPTPTIITSSDLVTTTVTTSGQEGVYLARIVIAMSKDTILQKIVFEDNATITIDKSVNTADLTTTSTCKGFAKLVNCYLEKESMGCLSAANIQNMVTALALKAGIDAAISCGDSPSMLIDKLNNHLNAQCNCD